MAAKLNLMKKAVDGNVAGFTALRDDVGRDTVAIRDLLEQGRDAMQVRKHCGNSCHALIGDNISQLARVSCRQFHPDHFPSILSHPVVA